MRIYSALTIIAIFQSNSFSQGIVKDATTGNIEVSLLADANYSVSEMNIPFETRGSVDGSSTNALYYAALSSGKDYALFALGKSSPVALGVSIFINFASAMLSTPNTQKRIYDFIVPVRGNYVFRCSFKGDIDNPRNRFIVASAVHGEVINFQDSYSGNVTRAFNAFLEPGCYSAEVSLGSGSSVFFHTAGTLDQVKFWSPTQVQFTLPFICTVKTHNIQGVLPYPGASSQLFVDFLGFPTSNPNIIIGNVSYGNIRPYRELVVRPDYSLLRPRNKPIHVIQPQFRLTSPPSISGERAVFQVQRDGDWVFDLYPDDWYDQDGDGIPDPP